MWRLLMNSNIQLAKGAMCVELQTMFVKLARRWSTEDGDDQWKWRFKLPMREPPKDGTRQDGSSQDPRHAWVEHPALLLMRGRDVLRRPVHVLDSITWTYSCAQHGSLHRGPHVWEKTALELCLVLVGIPNEAETGTTPASAAKETCQAAPQSSLTGG